MRFARTALALFVLLAGLWSAPPAAAAEVVMTESQVKALCLLNFTKYVSWPQQAFAETNSPIRIAIVGDPAIASELKRASQGKLIAGRPMDVAQMDRLDAAQAFHLVFIGASEKGRVAEHLSALGNFPTLTVGDSEGFTEAGGMILFVKRENKVRFEVNLAPARLAGLQISSRLLALADAVRGKE